MWSEAELDTIAAALNVSIASGEGRSWETGITEKGDAQLYLLGPLPDQACELCVSRIGGRYILEDGSGQLLFEHQSLALVALHAKAAMRSSWSGLVARVALLWCTIRYMIHDRLEPLLTESEEMLVHLAPQLAAFA
ncbi:MAG TPA: hypothetical protein VK522_13555 [Pseudolabrys sp.]|nr:hypothetical protein [Pseudolabrys sp.]